MCILMTPCHFWILILREGEREPWREGGERQTKLASRKAEGPGKVWILDRSLSSKWNRFLQPSIFLTYTFLYGTFSLPDLGWSGHREACAGWRLGNVPSAYTCEGRQEGSVGQGKTAVGCSPEKGLSWMHGEPRSWDSPWWWLDPLSCSSEPLAPWAAGEARAAVRGGFDSRWGMEEAKSLPDSSVLLSSRPEPRTPQLS